MGEYIERTKALQAINENYHDPKIDILLRSVPTADVAEVVLCKDCKYFGKTIKNGKHACMNFQMPYCTDDDYCSHAVRKVE